MSRTTIRAAGAVVLREIDGEMLVALVHRPGYDDWCLPKGKLKRSEEPHLAAVREVMEETGACVRLGIPLSPTQYALPRGDRKHVRWWVATAIDVADRAPDGEVDEVVWLPPAQAARRLTHADERGVLAESLPLPRTTPFVIVRHGKAISRKRWGTKKPDWLRPLARIGRAQADWLVEGLTPWAIDVVATSPSTRCLETIIPFAQAHGQIPVGYQALTEETEAVNPTAAGHVVADLARSAVLADAATLVCGHRPVLPVMCEALGVVPRPFETGNFVVAHLDRRARAVALEAVSNQTHS